MIKKGCIFFSREVEMLNINHMNKLGVEPKKLTKAIIITFVMVFVSSVNLMAQATHGGYAESYLLRNFGSRAISMAGAYTAISNEPFAVFYNPAGLGYFSEKPIVATTVGNIGMGRTNSTIAYGQQISENIGVGFGVNSMFSGSFISRDAMGNPHGKLSANQYTIAAFGAYSMEFASMGVGLKYLMNNLAGSPTEATGVALDIGTKFNVMNLFSFGLAVQNISGTMLWNKKQYGMESIPYTIRTGIAMEYGLNEQSYTSRSTTDGSLENVFVPATKYVLLGVDAIYNQYDLSPTFVIGTEVVLHEMIAFRSGIAFYGDRYGKAKFFPMTQWGAGISLRPILDDILPSLQFKTNIDYSVAKEQLAESGLAHYVSLVFEF